MKRSIALLASAVAVACCAAAGPAQADVPDEDSRAAARDIKAVVVLIGANDYGLADVPTRPPE